MKMRKQPRSCNFFLSPRFNLDLGRGSPESAVPSGWYSNSLSSSGVRFVKSVKSSSPAFVRAFQIGESSLISHTLDIRWVFAASHVGTAALASVKAGLWKGGIKDAPRQVVGMLVKSDVM